VTSVRHILAVAAPALAFLAGSVGLTAQSRIRTAVDTTLVTVGDRITMTVSVEHRAGTRVVWPDSISLAPFEVLGARVGPTETDGDVSLSSVTLTLAVFELGELEIPSFEVSVEGPGDEAEFLRTDRYGIEVLSVGADDSGDIRDIRGPLGIPIGAITIALGGLLALVLAGLAYALYRRVRGRSRVETGARGPPPRPAHEIAMEALAALEASSLLERRQVKDYHIEVSEILRTYVQRRFGVDAPEMTTIEVLSGLDNAGVDGTVRKALRRFLDQCDMVKFAKVRPEPEASHDVLTLGRQLVEDTIPAIPIPDADLAEAS